jgi:hypothetical protein
LSEKGKEMCPNEIREEPFHVTYIHTHAHYFFTMAQHATAPGGPRTLHYRSFGKHSVRHKILGSKPLNK